MHKPSERPAWITGFALVTILLVGAAVRFAYIDEHARAPDFSYPEVDATYHDYWARALVTGDWTPPPDREDPLIRSTPYLRPPGYPFFLAGIYRLSGTGYLAPRVFQAVLGLGACLLGFALARRRFGMGVGLTLAALTSVYWSFVYFEGELLEPALLVFLGLLLLFLLDRWTDRITVERVVSAGIVLGLLALVRPTIIPFGAASVAWAWGLKEERLRLGMRRFVLMLALFVSSAVVVVLPAMIRNLAVSGEPVIVSAGGLNLYIGNNEQADGLAASNLDGLGSFRTCFDYRGIVRNLEKRVGRPLSSREISNHFRDKALRFILEHPAKVLSLAVKKTLLFWGPLEVSHNREDEFARADSPVLRSLPGNFSFAFAAFLVGILVFAWDGRKGTVEQDSARRAQVRLVSLTSLYILCIFLAHLPFFVAGRYRVPVVPGLFLIGSYGLWRIGQEVAERRFHVAALLSAAGLLLYFLVSRNPAGYAPDGAKWHFALGLAKFRTGDLEGARKSYEETLRFKPDFEPAHLNLGMLDFRAGELRAAEEHMRRALALAPDDPVVYDDLGWILSKIGKTEEAVAAYEKALAANPEFADAHTGLAIQLEKLGDVPGASFHYGEAARLNGDGQ